MNVLVVARREWIGRRNLFLLALGLGLVQFLALWSEASSIRWSEKATFMGTLTGTGLAWVVAGLYGATMIGRELEERRFSFYLRQPLALGELFLGKVLAGLTLSVLAGLLVFVPGYLLCQVWTAMPLRELPKMVGIWLAGSLALLLFFHAASIQLRARSPWLVLDLAAWTAFGFGVRHLTRSLLTEADFPSLGGLWLGQLVLVTLGLGAAGYLQVIQGRADLQRGHRWLSLTLAAALVLSLLAGWLQVTWVRSHAVPRSPAHPAGTPVR